MTIRAFDTLSNVLREDHVSEHSSPILHIRRAFAVGDVIRILGAFAFDFVSAFPYNVAEAIVEDTGS